MATSSSVTTALASSNVQGVQQLWHCDAHALGHDRAGGCPGHRPCLDTGQHLPHASTHQSGVPPHLRPSRLSPLIVLVTLLDAVTPVTHRPRASASDLMLTPVTHQPCTSTLDPMWV